jgi:hypothetical protein
MRRYYQNDSYILQTLRYEYWTLSVTYHKMLLTPDARSMIKLTMFVREHICIFEPETDRSSKTPTQFSASFWQNSWVSDFLRTAEYFLFSSQLGIKPKNFPEKVSTQRMLFTVNHKETFVCPVVVRDWIMCFPSILQTERRPSNGSAHICYITRNIPTIYRTHTYVKHSKS